MEIKKIFINRHWNWLTWIGLLLICLLGGPTAQAQIVDLNETESELIEGRIRIKVKEESINDLGILGQGARSSNGRSMGVSSIDQISDRVGITKVKRVFPYSAKHEAKHRKYGLHLWYELEFDPEVRPEDVVKEYETVVDLDIVKPVYKKTRIDGNAKPKIFKKSGASTWAVKEDTVVFNDPLIMDQWHYHNDGTIVGEEDFDIDLFEAWDVTAGSSEIIVSVVDQGIDVYHEDLQENIWRNEAEINGEEGVDDDGNGYVDDFFGYNFRMDGAVTAGSHGTHVAGTIGAIGNNGKGVAGVAGGNGQGNGVKLMSCQVFDDRANGGSNFAGAIVYGADNGALISQNSWGYNQPDYYEPEVLDAVQYFVAEAGQYEGSLMKGGILFFANGNNGGEFRKYPAGFEETVAVSATGPNGFPAPYTNYGEWTDISAPGGDMTNFGEMGGVLSTLPDDEYGYIEGTSMATPHVSGVAALVISKFGGETFTAEDLKRIVLNSTDRLVFIHENKYGKGYLNASKALLDDNRIPPNAVDDLAAKEIFHNEVRLSWTVPDDDSGNEPLSYYLAVAESQITPDNFDSQALYLLNNDKGIGETFEINITGFLKETEYWFAVKSNDQFENLSDISNVLHVTTSREPHFMSSTHSIEFDIDVTSSTTQTTPLTFSNIGDGIIYWNSLVSNEVYYTDPVEEEEIVVTTNTLQYKREQTSQQSSVLAMDDSDAVLFKSIEAMPFAAGIESVSLDHWQNDVTEFKHILTYDNQTNPAIFMGSGLYNAGFSIATRYDVPYDYYFNLTHVETVLYPETNEYPIIVEIKRGGRKDIFEAETVYMEKYYPDTTEVLKYYRIPIYRPQRFEDNESFWVVLHFPKEMEFPMAAQYAYEEVDLGRFVFSRDNGRSYEDLYHLQNRYILPMVDALSTGDDGSYVFIDPASGEISGGNSQVAQTTIDASHLTNGPHLASLGIITNDIHKPMINIEVKVNVTGQTPEVDNDKLYAFEAFKDRTNSLILELENTGLADLEINDLTSGDAGFTKAFDDMITIEPGTIGEVAFEYTTSLTGLITTNLTSDTNIGNLTFRLDVTSKEEPIITLDEGVDPIVIDYETGGTLSVEIGNASAGADLEFDLDHYSLAATNGGLFARTLEYEVLSSKDLGGPAANQWDDITGYGTYMEETSYINVDLDMRFPFFDETMDNLFTSSLAQLQMYFSAYLQPIKLSENSILADEVYYHNFGDRSVFSFKGKINERQDTSFETVGELTYQIVLFRDGTIEYRYKDVDDLADYTEYLVLVKGVADQDSILYRDFDTVGKELSNGEVIRFAPTTDINLIANTSDLSGVVSPGGSTTVDLFLDPKEFGMPAGTYDTEVYVRANTFDGTHQFPITVTVTGTPNLEYEEEKAFGTVRIGQTAVEYLEVNNVGSDEVQITAINTNSADVTVEPALPITIAALSNYPLPLSYSPTSVGALDVDMTITLSSGEVVPVELTGNGEIDPQYSHTIPATIEVDLTAGEKTTIPFSIANTRSGTDIGYLFLNSSHVFADTEPSSTATTVPIDGLHEGFGYSWKAGDESKVSYQWQDITKEGDMLLFDNDESYKVDLPFDFPFYGEKFGSIWITNRGYVSVIEPEELPLSTIFQKDDGIKGMIAPLWGEIRSSDPEKGVYYTDYEDHVIIQWDNYEGVDGNLSPGTLNFQLEMYSDGRIYFHYREFKEYGGLIKFGLESPDESEVLEDSRAIIAPYATFGDSTSLVIAAPHSKLLKPLQTQDLALTISAENLFYTGTYEDSIELITNSDAQRSMIIPVKINVTGGTPQAAVPSQLVWGEVVYKEDLTITQFFTIENVGYNILSVDNISFQNLDGLDLYDANGDKIIKTTGGTLLNPLEIAPWEELVVEVHIPVNEKVDVEGSMTLSGNFNSKSIAIEAEIVDSPVFVWNATNQNLTISQTNQTTFGFKVENNGPSTLEFEVIPAVIPSSDAPTHVGEVEEIGPITYNRPVVVDSVALDYQEIATGVFTPNSGSAVLAFANHFVAPEGGITITHVKVFYYLNLIDQYISVKIYSDADLPQEGDLLYQQEFVISEEVDREWIYLELEEPIYIPEGEGFFVAMSQPFTYASQYIGFDFSDDNDDLERVFTGVYQSEGEFYWWAHSTTLYDQRIWKIRPLSGSGDDRWIDVDHKKGKLLPGESLDITATIDPAQVPGGKQRGKIIATSNDINASYQEVEVNVDVNGAPIFNYYPNIYQDTLQIIETEEIVLNYLLSEPENETISIALEESIDRPEAQLTVTGDYTAQVKIETDYESAGVYKYPITVSDLSGNVVYDSIVVQVLDKNRPPVFNEEYAVLHFNLAAELESFAIDPNELFTDPDGDTIQVYAGNFNPEIVDLAFGNAYMAITPRQEGTAALAFAADDFREDGFTLVETYAQVINDPDAVFGETDGFGMAETLMNEFDTDYICYPNPAKSGETTQLFFMLEESAEVTITLLDAMGQVALNHNMGVLDQGTFAYEVDLKGLPKGIFYAQLVVNNNSRKTTKILIY
ncbi:S8 family serine peptidase [Reichenbachiella sp.]